jgi:hypothetical protein
MLKQVLCASVMLTNKYKCKNNSYELLCNVVCRKNASKPDVPMYIYCTEDEIQTKVSRVFLRAIHSHLYSFALKFIFFKLMQPLTYFFKLTQTSYVFLQFSYCTL